MAPTNGSTVTTLDIPKGPAKKAMTTAPVGNSFTENDRLYRSYAEFSTVFEELDLDLAQIRMMLSKDGNPRKLEQVLTLPIRGAGWEIRGDGPEADLARENLGPLLNEVIAQATSAFSFRKAFFEIVWKLEGDQVLYDQILMRPAVTCEAAFDEHTGEPLGFRQRLAPVSVFGTTTGEMGYERIPKIRSFIYTYGTHREPLRGLSDMDVALYCWDQIRKLQFLWCQYLEGTALPKILVKGSSPEEAQENARQIAKAKASGVIPVEWRPEMVGERLTEILESSGKGAEQFEVAIRYFEGKQTSSVLASFTDLAQAAVSGKGSNALSADQSEFFLSACQGKADEMSWQITKGLIEPLVRYNFGPDAQVPQLYIGPIGNRQLDRALDLLKSIMAAQNPTAPPKFTASLMTHVASFLGLEQEDVSSAAQEWANQQAEAKDYQAQLSELMKLQRAQLGAAAAGPQPPAPGTKAPAPDQKALPPGKTKAEMAADRDALQLATPVQLQLNLTTDDDDAETHTGGMVALLPDADSAAKLLVDGGDPIDQLHLTLCYLGDNVTGWSQSQRDQVVQRATSAAEGRGPVDGDAFAHAVFNPDGAEPCAVYLIGGSDAFAELNQELRSLASALQHPGFVAHVTAGYGMTADDLAYTGPVRFDRIGVFFGGQRIEIPLVARRDSRYPNAELSKTRSGRDALDLGFNKDEPRVPGGNHGAGQWTKGLFDALRDDGGFTFNPRSRALVRTGEQRGYAIAVPHTEVMLGNEGMTREQFQDAFVRVVAKNRDAIARGAYIGGWKSDGRGDYLVELSEIHDVSRDEAIAIGRGRNQEAIRDMMTGEFLDTGGTGG